MTPADVTPEQRAAELQRCRENGHRGDWLPWPFDPCPVGEKVLRPYVDPMSSDAFDGYEPMLVVGADEREFLPPGPCALCGHVGQGTRNPFYGWWRMRTLDPAKAALRVFGSDKLMGEHDIMEYPPRLVRAVACDECRGTGAVDDVDNGDRCLTCGGVGMVPAPEVPALPVLPALTVKLPAEASVIRNTSSDRVLFLHADPQFSESHALALAPDEAVGNLDHGQLYATWDRAPVAAHPVGGISVLSESVAAGGSLLRGDVL